MSEEATKKRKIRGGHKTSAKRTINASSSILDDFDPSNKQLTDKLLQQRITLKEKLDILQNLDNEILVITEEKDIEKEIEESDLLRERIHATIVRIDSALSSANLSLSTSPEGTQEVGNHNSSTISQTSAKIRLPKLSLKKFKGDIKEWTPFWDSYSSAIHDNPDLSDIDKFNYLNSLLESSAAEAISGLKITSANYMEAVDVLKQRFGNRQQIINSHMDSLLQLPTVTSLHDVQGIRRLYDKIESHVRGLKSLGVKTESYGDLMISMLMQRLPPGLRITVTKKMEEEEWSLDKLLTISTRIRGQRKGKFTKPPVSKSSNQRYRPASGAALLFGHHDTTCSYCQGKHLSANCKTVTNVVARKDILKRNGRCFVCLKKNHISRECQSNHKCFKCGRRHHASLCMGQPQHPNPTFNQTQNQLQQQSEGPYQPTQEPERKDEKPSSQTTGSGNKNFPVQLNRERNHQQQQQQATTSQAMYVDTRTSILLQTAKVNIYKPGTPESRVNARLILDSGSQRSYVTTRVKNRLNLNAEGTENLMIKTFGGEVEQLQTCEYVQFNIETKPTYPDILITAYAVPTICQPLSHQTTEAAKKIYRHLEGLNLADLNTSDEELEVDILVGSDQYWNLVTGAVRRGDSGPNAMETKVGWVLSGPVTDSMNEKTSIVNLVDTHVLKCAMQPSTSDPTDVTQELRRFWELESLGVFPNDESVYERFTQSIKLRDKRYEVELPWKESHPDLPDNFQLCEKRLKHLLTRLRKDPEIMQEYNNVIAEQRKEGIVEVVDEHNTGEIGKVHYLPHHAVIQRDKSTTKMRIVYDASAKDNGPSLNDCLYTGPALAQNILDILLRFRCHKVALVGDIEKAFLMLLIQEPDRDVLRFLWVDDIDNPNPKITTLRFTRVVFGVSSSPFLLNATVKHHMEQYRSSDPEFVEKFLESIYVDDLNAGEENDDEAFLLYKKSKLRLAEGGFNLRKFYSNSPTLMTRINENESHLTTDHHNEQNANSVFKEIKQDESRSNQVWTMEHDESYTKETTGNLSEPVKKFEQKILGVKWNYKQDCFVFDFAPIAQAAKECEPTKRNVISIASKFYDPLGFMSPIIIQMKLLFQSLCDDGLEWDVPLTGELRLKWLKLVDDLGKTKPITLSRCYFVHINEKVVARQLHGFCDASISAYAAVIYLVVTTTTQRYAALVTAKTTVAPSQKQTIPRLELLSAVVLARLMKTTLEALKSVLELDENVICWTDSLVTLYWIRGETKEWKQFVQLRVNEVRSLIPSSWRHCPGVDNPADIPTRSIKFSELGECEHWRSGPKWLSEQLNPNEELEDDSDSPPRRMFTRDEEDATQCTDCIVNRSDKGGFERVNNH